MHGVAPMAQTAGDGTVAQPATAAAKAVKQLMNATAKVRDAVASMSIMNCHAGQIGQDAARAAASGSARGSTGSAAQLGALAAASAPAPGHETRYLCD